MRHHVLLQAIARVNRPYEDGEGRRKSSGFILEFVAIFDRLEKALAFDSEEVQSVVEGIEVLQNRFRDLIHRARTRYLKVSEGLTQDKVVEAVLEHFRDEEEREGFFEFFKELEGLYEILSPGPLLRPYLEDCETLSRMYQIVKTAYQPGCISTRIFEEDRVAGAGAHGDPLYKAPGRGARPYPGDLEGYRGRRPAEYGKGIQSPDSDPQARRGRGWADALHTVYRGEGGEAIVEAFEQRLATSQKAIEDLSVVVEDFRKARDRREESGLSDGAFAAYVFLEGRSVHEAEQIINEASEAFERNRYWREPGTGTADKVRLVQGSPGSWSFGLNQPGRRSPQNPEAQQAMSEAQDQRQYLEEAVAADVFRSEVSAWAARIGVERRQVTLRSMSRKWASCSTAGRITF